MPIKGQIKIFKMKCLEKDCGATVRSLAKLQYCKLCCSTNISCEVFNNQFEVSKSNNEIAKGEYDG